MIDRRPHIQGESDRFALVLATTDPASRVPTCPDWNAVDLLKHRLGIDDALDVFAAHGVGGIWGALATGLFAEKAINGVNGLFFGNPEQLLKQAVAVVVVALFAGTVTAGILKAIDLTIGLRVPEQEEVLGLDSTIHGELAYQL